MAYLLAFILPLTFFYSPKIEKSNIVMVTKPLTITQERNTPVSVEATDAVASLIKPSVDECLATLG